MSRADEWQDFIIFGGEMPNLLEGVEEVAFPNGFKPLEPTKPDIENTLLWELYANWCHQRNWQPTIKGYGLWFEERYRDEW